MSALNIFEEEWRDCLRAHYFHVIKERDTNNEVSLISVLIQTGFTEDDIAAMRAEVLAELDWTPDEPPIESAETAGGEPAEDPVAAQPEPLVQATEPESAAPESSEPPPDEPDLAATDEKNRNHVCGNRFALGKCFGLGGCHG